jgi:uncharacterized metal-binding protein YceD (DUF177 family)
MMEPERPWSVPLRLDDVPETGLGLHLAADEATRERIARFAGLQALPRLEADFVMTRRGRGLRVAGEVSATVGQTCVVTLDPMENEVVEAVDLGFAPAADEDVEGSARNEAEADRPEPLRHGCVDLGAIATEFLVLGIDPYPRKPGAVFAPPASAATEDGPFAALAALKSGGGGGCR